MGSAALLAVCWLTASGALAGEAPALPSGVPVSPPRSLPPESAAREAVWAAELADLYGVPPALVASLRELGLDHVETECAVAVSTHAKRPVAEVLELRRAGMTWGEVARSYGFFLLEAIRQTPGEKPRSPGARRAEVRKFRTNP